MRANTVAMATGFRGWVRTWLAKAGVVAGLLLLPLFAATWLEIGPDTMAFAGSGKPDERGKGSGDLYADLVFLYRTVDGLPIYIGVPEGMEEDVEPEVALRTMGAIVSAVPEGYVACEQPIAENGAPDQAGMIAAYIGSTYPLLTNPLLNLADGRDVTPIPLGGTGVAGEECDILYDPDTDPEYDFREYPEEVKFGRINVGRSPERVLRQQLNEVVKLMTNGPNTEIGWDHAGRITVNGVAIDSPLQSLAIHETLMEHGAIIGAPALPDLSWNDLIPPLPEPPMDDLDWLDYAASALGGAADKDDWLAAGIVNLDLVVYNNRVLHIPDETNWADTLEGDGIEGALHELYVDYSGYGYKRSDKYPGCFAGLGLGPAQGFIMNAVFGGEDFDASNVFGFATAADDARRVISFSHAYLEGSVFDKAGSDTLCYDLGLLP